MSGFFYAGQVSNEMIMIELPTKLTTLGELNWQQQERVLCSSFSSGIVEDFFLLILKSFCTFRECTESILTYSENMQIHSWRIGQKYLSIDREYYEFWDVSCT